MFGGKIYWKVIIEYFLIIKEGREWLNMVKFLIILLELFIFVFFLVVIYLVGFVVFIFVLEWWWLEL